MQETGQGRTGLQLSSTGEPVNCTGRKSGAFRKVCGKNAGRRDARATAGSPKIDTIGAMATLAHRVYGTDGLIGGKPESGSLRASYPLDDRESLTDRRL